MILALCNQMHQEWQRTGLPAQIKVHMHPATIDESLMPYSDGRSLDRVNLRWGTLYPIPDLTVGKGMAIIEFIRKPQSERPDDV